MNGTANMAGVPIPARMTAIAISAPGGPEVLKPVTLAVPVPGPGEVLIRVRAAGINRPDVMQRQGKYPPPPGAPETPGLEIAGEVVAAGADVIDALVGQRVCALIVGGGYADYALAHAAHCLVLPDALSFTEAAAIPETLFTVWSNLFERAYVADGDTVLVHGGTSGIGTMAIALCGLFDIRIFVTCGSDDKCDAARALGAIPINYKMQDFVEVIKAETGGKGVDAVLDMVGGDYVPRNLQCLGDDGRHVSIAVMGGPKATIFLPEIMQRRLTLTGSTLRPRSPAFKAMLTSEIHKSVWPMVEAGELRPVIDRIFPLSEVAAAHARMDAGEHVGKIVLEI
ncbi:NAD(P)H-quinone oxidoreductase [soil metagenome]